MKVGDWKKLNMLSISKSESKVLLHFSIIKRDWAPPDAFAKGVNVAYNTEQWYSKLTGYSPSTIRWSSASESTVLGLFDLAW